MSETKFEAEDFTNDKTTKFLYHRINKDFGDTAANIKEHKLQLKKVILSEYLNKLHKKVVETVSKYNSGSTDIIIEIDKLYKELKRRISTGETIMEIQPIWDDLMGLIVEHEFEYDKRQKMVVGGGAQMMVILIILAILVLFYVFWAKMPQSVKSIGTIITIPPWP